MEVWRNICKQHLGRKILRHSQSLMINISAVDVGIKPAYLYDIGQPRGEKLKHLVGDLKHQELIQNNLNVVEIGMDCVILNVEEFKKWTESVEISDKLIDVSKSKDSPCFVTQEEAVVNLKEVTEKLRDELDSSRVKLSALTSVSCNVSSLFGLMLNYPLIYWYDDSDGKGGNCLSMEKLVSVKVMVTCAIKSKRKPYTETKVIDHCLYSFSFPFCLNSMSRPVVELWFDKLKEKLHGQETFTDMKIAVEEVTLEAVSL